jgi:hypothetical protein
MEGNHRVEHYIIHCPPLEEVSRSAGGGLSLILL